MATALTQMSSLAYAGTTVDILKKLTTSTSRSTPTCDPGVALADRLRRSAAGSERWA